MMVAKLGLQRSARLRFNEIGRIALNISKWEPGCIFKSLNGIRVVERCPTDGTCSSRVSGVWYSNAEINDYLNYQRSWLPWGGLFGIVPRLGRLHHYPKGQSLVGWFKVSQ